MGVVAMGLTVWAALTALKLRRNTLVIDTHPICGLIASVLTVALTIGGLTSLIARKYSRLEWRT